MSVVQYKCDTCDRIIDIPQNKKGLEIVQKCIITDGCHGKLSQIDFKLDHIRGNFPARVENLDDYINRKILFNHNQSIKLEEWNIVHKLGVLPFSQVFVERPKIVKNIENLEPADLVELIEIEPESIETVSINEILIKFDRPERGIAQLIATSSSKKQEFIATNISTDIKYEQISNDSEITIATLNTDQSIQLEFKFISPSGEINTTVYTIDDTPSIKSPWVNFNKIYVKGKSYTVRSFNIFSNILSIQNGSSFILSKINNLQINENDILLLNSSYPYTSNDKNIKQYIDLYNINGTNSINQTLYNTGEISINEKQIMQIYPYIKQI